MLGDILASMQLFDRSTSKFLNRHHKEESTSNIATRLVVLFESHGVHRNQIPELFGHGLDIPSCESNEKLLEKITP
jgi:hypothetical protein